MDISSYNSASASSDESLVSHNSTHYLGDSNFDQSIDKSQTLRILNPTSHNNTSNVLDTDDNDDDEEESDESTHLKKFKLNDGSNQLMQNDDNDDEESTNKDSKRLNKIKRQERLKKRLLSELRMSDNEDFDFEEQELLHSKRSFRERQRIDYNENKRPTKSSSSSSAIITNSSSSKPHIQNNNKTINSISPIKYQTKSNTGTRTPSVVLRLGKREKPSSSAPLQKKTLGSARKSKKTKKTSPINARGADGKFLKRRGGRLKNSKSVENELLELTDDTSEDWDSDFESEYYENENEADKTHSTEFEFEETQYDERNEHKAIARGEKKVKEIANHGKSNSYDYFDGFEKKNHVGINIDDDKVDTSFVNLLVEKDMASKLASLVNSNDSSSTNNLPSIKIEEATGVDSMTTSPEKMSVNGNELHKSQEYQEFDQLEFLETPEDLENYQKLLTSEYSKLSQDFANSTTARIDQLVDLIDLTVGKTKTDYSTYKKRIENSRENLKHKRLSISNSKKNNHSNNAYDNLITRDTLEKFKDPRPMDFPIFHGFFEDLMRPKFSLLEALKKRSIYELGLIENETISNVTIIELQLQRAIQENREAMREQILRDLDSLNLEFYDRLGVPVPNSKDELVKASSLDENFKKTLLFKTTDVSELTDFDRQFGEGNKGLEALANLVSSVSKANPEINRGDSEEVAQYATHEKKETES